MVLTTPLFNPSCLEPANGNNTETSWEQGRFERNTNKIRTQQNHSALNLNLLDETRHNFVQIDKSTSHVGREVLVRDLAGGRQREPAQTKHSKTKKQAHKKQLYQAKQNHCCTLWSRLWFISGSCPPHHTYRCR